YWSNYPDAARFDRSIDLSSSASPRPREFGLARNQRAYRYRHDWRPTSARGRLVAPTAWSHPKAQLAPGRDPIRPLRTNKGTPMAIDQNEDNACACDQTITQWRKKKNFSLSTYHKLQRMGLGPHVTEIIALTEYKARGLSCGFRRGHYEIK